MRGSVETLADILCRIVAAQDGLLFAENAVASLHFVVEDRARSDERLVLKTQMTGDKFGVGTERRIIGGLGEFDAVRSRERVVGRGRKVDNTQIWEAALAFEQSQVGLEDVRRCEHYVRTGGDDLAPEFAAWIFHGDSHQAEGPASRVGANVEDASGTPAFEAGMMVGVILVRVFARIDQPEFRLRLIGGQVADLAGGVAGTGEKKKSTAARALDVDAKSFVALFVE